MANMGRDGDQHYELEASDEFHTYDATDGSGGSRTTLLSLLFLIAVLVFGGILYFAYQQGIREGVRNAPPLIEAEDGPVKVVPDDPGGMDIPNTDKLIYDRMNGNNPAEPRVERLLPRAEEPMVRPDVPDASPEDVPRERIEVLPPPLDIVPDAATVTPERSPENIVPVPVAPTNREVPSVLPNVPAVPVVPVQAAAEGNFVVQIAAFRNEPRAEEEFIKLQVAHPDLLGSLRSDIARADLGDRGIYYRLRVGPFATKDAAGALCTRLKGRGQDCIVRER